MPTSTTIQWLSLVGNIWLQSITGTNSDFPAYSSQLKQLLSISQIQLNNLAFASDAGKLFGWFPGVAAAHLPLWLVLLIGSTLGAIGYGVQFLFLSKRISSLSYWQFFFLTVLAGNSICWINTVCNVTAIRKFPFDRQVAVGLSTSYSSLTAKIFTNIVDWVFSSSSMKKAEGYLLLNSIVPLGVSMLTAPLVREVEMKKEKEKHIDRGFILMFVITIVTGIYAVFGSMGIISNGISPWIHVVGMVVLLATPLVIPLVTWVRMVLETKPWWNNSLRERRIYDLPVVEVGVIDGIEILEIKEELGFEVEEDGEIIKAKEEIGVKLMVQRLEFWLYFFVYMFGATLGLVYLNNLGQVAESRGHSHTSSLVSLSSSFGFFGRLLPSLMDHFFSKSRYMVSRTASIVLLMIPMAGAFFLLLNPNNLSLYISTVVIGVCVGAISSVSVSMTPELFGTKNFSVNHNIVIANIPIGSLMFGNMAAILYQRAGYEGHGRCMGVGCYRNTFIIWGSTCSLGTLLAFILYLRTRKFYLQRLKE
ncbi:protein NUCLEAR FUSION DEFECTIVE 4-like [Telopea speciosissima]|uniref:protein NUCLEAR FUSION DEFECTIVE 4-like n=1 Tax=Telopea speciosissima TaxID=54955 RepID=UPI001CC80F55|nr:protein NUCLEAR FUSION DEFECTIVE 4-like [Telopea speciosissima]